MILPDVMRPALKVAFCDTAAGTRSAQAGAYYAGPGNSFWATLHQIGLTPRELRPSEYKELLSYGVGLNDICKESSGSDREVGTGGFKVAALTATVERCAPPGWRSMARTPPRALSDDRSSTAGNPSGSGRLASSCSRRPPARRADSGMCATGTSWRESCDRLRDRSRSTFTVSSPRRWTTSRPTTPLSQRGRLPARPGLDHSDEEPDSADPAGAEAAARPRGRAGHPHPPRPRRIRARAEVPQETTGGDRRRRAATNERDNGRRVRADPVRFGGPFRAS